MITKEDILKKVNQEHIFKFYFPYTISYRKKYINPFRKDKNPGCTFKMSRSGILYFTDWATHEQYDCFQVAQLVTGENNFQNLLKRINKDLDLGLMPTSLKIPKKTMNITNEQPKENFYQKKETQYQIQEKNEFSEYDYVFWKNECIKKETLDYFRVKAIDHFSINDFIVQSSVHFPIFKYSLEEGQFQLYCPFHEIRFFSKKEPYYLMAYDFLPLFGKNVLITSSFKDIMQNYQVGVPSVCPDSETSGIKREDLIRLFKRFDNVWINFNNDAAGIKAAKELKEKFSDLPLKFIFTEKGKDPTEVVKNNGQEELIKQYKAHGIIDI